MIDVDRIWPSATNPRRTINKSQLEELAASIRAVGIIEPILVLPADAAGTHELVCGERRWRAAQLAALRTVPAQVRALTKQQVLEIQLIENLQREDVSALEEATGYKRLMEDGVTVAEIQQRVGKSEKYVYDRVKLLALTPDAQAALADGRLTAGHAILLARLQPKDQARALADGCFERWGEKGLVSVRDLDEWIEDNVRCLLAGVAFPIDDFKLVPAAGACGKCEKRGGDRCFDPECFKSKQAAFVEREKTRLAKAGKEFRLITRDFGNKELKGGVLQANLYQAAKEGTKGAITGVVVSGPRAGELLSITLKNRSEEKPAARVNHEAERAKKEERAARETAVRTAILDAVLATVKAPLERPELELIARRLYSAGGEGGDWIAARLGLKPVFDADEAHVFAALKPQQLAHALVCAALADEIAVSTYYETDAKELLAAAKRAKVDVAKVRKAAEAAWKPAEKAENK